MPSFNRSTKEIEICMSKIIGRIILKWILSRVRVT